MTSPHVTSTPKAKSKTRKRNMSKSSLGGAGRFGRSVERPVWSSLQAQILRMENPPVVHPLDDSNHSSIKGDQSNLNLIQRNLNQKRMSYMGEVPEVLPINIQLMNITQIQENKNAQQRYIDSMKKKKKSKVNSKKVMMLKDLKPEIYQCLFKRQVDLKALLTTLSAYLGPGLETFKLCLLNSMAYKIIQPKIKEDRLEHAKGSFLKVLGDENPDMKKYQGSSPYQIQKALKLQLLSN